jgi:multidrug resistance efflux pump
MRAFAEDSPHVYEAERQIRLLKAQNMLLEAQLKDERANTEKLKAEVKLLEGKVAFLADHIERLTQRGFFSTA